MIVVHSVVLSVISIHALRKEGDLNLLYYGRSDCNFYPRPPQGGRPRELRCCEKHTFISIHALRKEGDLQAITQGVYNHIISIHALRKEGDSKNGEKHLRFCFIIKRSAQIWKSLSKNIRKNSCDLHRTA